MVTKVKKWGNSLGIRFPSALATQANIFDGSKVNLIMKKNKIEIIPIESEEYTLDVMLSKISDLNIHKEIDVGNSVGKEL